MFSITPGLSSVSVPSRVESRVFFFQAEDGIRDLYVTGVQTCALPIFIPSNPPKTVEADRENLRQALQRTAILSNEKYRGIRLTARPDLLTLQAHNPEQEEAEDQVEVSYKGEEVEIGFNVNYLLDALSAIEGDKVQIGLTDSNSSCLIHAPGTMHTRYVVMPMRL